MTADPTDVALEQLALRRALAYEARVVEAHVEGYSRISRRLAATAAGIIERLRGAALDEPLVPELRRRVLRQEATEVASMLDQASLPKSRRTFCADQVERMRLAGAGGEEQAYAGVRLFGSSLEALERTRA